MCAIYHTVTRVSICFTTVKSTTVVEHNYKLKPGPYHKSCSWRKMSRPCGGAGGSIRLQLVLMLRGVAGSSLHDAPREPFAPDILSSRHRRRDRCSSLQLMSHKAALAGKIVSGHGIKAGLVSKSQRIFSEKTLQLDTQLLQHV